MTLNTCDLDPTRLSFFLSEKDDVKTEWKPRTFLSSILSLQLITTADECMQHAVDKKSLSLAFVALPKKENIKKTYLR